MVKKYEKLNSKFNVYPFKTCPKCGLTYAIMGDNPSRLKKDNNKSTKNSKVGNLNLIEDDENNRSLMINLDSFDDYPTHELVDESNEFLLVDMLDFEDYGKNKFFNEKFEHSFYCTRYKAAKKKYHPHVVDYQERCYIVNKILPMLNMNQDLSTKELLIHHFCEILFTESLEMTDFSLSHPRFQEFVSLLWNTQWFLEEMQKYLTQKELNKIKSKYPQNHGLRRNLKWWTADKDVEDYDDDEDDFNKFTESLGNNINDTEIGDFFL